MEVSNEVLANKIDNLQSTLDRLEESMSKLDAEQRQSELNAARDNARIENKADSAHRRIDNLVTQLGTVQKELPTLILAYRVMAFIGGALGLSVIALIWALITGQAKITFAP